MTVPVPPAFARIADLRILIEADATARYEKPERGPAGHAAGVLVVQSEAAVGEVLKAASAIGAALVVSAGRTGLVEAQRPEGEWVLSLEKLNRILSIDSAQRTAMVEAGVTVDALNEALAPHGLVWPMEMGSTSACTVGACIANGSAGANAVCYGTAAQLCGTAWGFWANGNAAGPCAGPAWAAPDVTVTAIDSAAPNPALGLIGTQGVLGLITRAQLRLHTLPAQREAALLPVTDMPAAMRVLAQARSVFGNDVEEFEFISRAALRLVREAKGANFRLPYPAEVDAPFHMLLQIRSSKPAEEDDLAARLYGFLTDTLQLPDEQLGYAPLKALKEIRHSISESSNHAMKRLGGGRLAFDTATPVARFGDYLAALEAALTAQFPGVLLVAFGHAGVGGAHLHLLGTAAAPVSARAEALIKLVFDVTAQYGGTFSAEHGVGTKWGAAFAERAAPAVVAALVAAKRDRDPACVLNPRSFGLDQLIQRQ